MLQLAQTVTESQHVFPLLAVQFVLICILVQPVNEPYKGYMPRLTGVLVAEIYGNAIQDKGNALKTIEVY